MLDTLYSVTLATAIALTELAICAELWHRFTSSGLTARFVAPLAVAALGADAVSLAVHLFGGHSPGSEQALDAIDFVQEHPAFWLVAGLASASLVASLIRQPREPHA